MKKRDKRKKKKKEDLQKNFAPFFKTPKNVKKRCHLASYNLFFGTVCMGFSYNCLRGWMSVVCVIVFFFLVFFVLFCFWVVFDRFFFDFF